MPYKPLADSTLSRMTKAEIIEVLRCAEHNAQAFEETLNQHIENVKDWQPVTYCKDCKYYDNHPNGLCYLHTEPKANARGYSGEAVCVEPDDFCSHGEPKKEET